MSDNPQVFQLECSVQNYAWGKIGSDSVVAKLRQSVDPDFQIKEDAPYAELWMGTHPNGPSMVVIPNKPKESLAEWIKKNSEKLGAKVRDYFHGELPFLFKVLSVRTSLSIQAHPNKTLADVLHKNKPDIYKDKNHKPEMAIALTPFQGLCGFRPINEVATYLEDIIELRTAVGSHCALRAIGDSKCVDMPKKREAMKLCFKGLMEQEDGIIKEQLKRLVARVKEMKSSGDKQYDWHIGDVLLKLDEEFPGDRGGFAIYFLNIITLQPGEAMFLEANLPHAYLSGDCMECMACSDNVVRAGLTIKIRDVHTLVEMLDYSGKEISKTKFKGITDCGSDGEKVTVTVFRPQVTDFAVNRYQVAKGVDTLHLPSMKSASICIAVEGSGEVINATLGSPLPIKQGSVFFISAEEDVKINLDKERSMLLFRAYAGL